MSHGRQPEVVLFPSLERLEAIAFVMSNRRHKNKSFLVRGKEQNRKDSTSGCRPWLKNICAYKFPITKVHAKFLIFSSYLIYFLNVQIIQKIFIPLSLSSMEGHCKIKRIQVEPNHLRETRHGRYFPGQHNILRASNAK